MKFQDYWHNRQVTIFLLLFGFLALVGTCGGCQ